VRGLKTHVGGLPSVIIWITGVEQILKPCQTNSHQLWCEFVIRRTRYSDTNFRDRISLLGGGEHVRVFTLYPPNVYNTNKNRVFFSDGKLTFQRVYYINKSSCVWMKNKSVHIYYTLGKRVEVDR